jgi:hypothetical protein
MLSIAGIEEFPAQVWSTWRRSISFGPSIASDRTTAPAPGRIGFDRLAALNDRPIRTSQDVEGPPSHRVSASVDPSPHHLPRYRTRINQPAIALGPDSRRSNRGCSYALAPGRSGVLVNFDGIDNAAHLFAGAALLVLTRAGPDNEEQITAWHNP